MAAVGHVVQIAQEAADQMAATGISVEVVDILSLSPLDTQTIIRSVGKTGRLIVADDTPQFGGAASGVLAAVMPDIWPHLGERPQTLGRMPIPLPFNRGLEELATVTVSRLVEAINAIMGEAQNHVG